VTERIYLLDVSSVQRGIDWDRVVEHDPGAAFGRPPGRIRGVVAKASEARSPDPRTREHIEGARMAGLSVGVYHFARVRGAALEQADYAIDRACELGDDPGELPIWLDLEERGAAARLGGPDAYVEWIVAWCERIEARGYRAGIYTAPVYGSEWRGARHVAELARWPLWVAQYSHVGAWCPTDADRPLAVPPWPAAAVWQYSGGGPGLPGNTVPGVSGYVDLNLVNGGLETFRALLGLPGEEPDMGGPVHGTHVVEASLDERAAGQPEGRGCYDNHSCRSVATTVTPTPEPHA